MKELSPETKLLITLLKEKYETLTLITYEELEKMVRFSTSKKRFYLTSALRVLQVNYGYLFRCITCVGYEPLSDSAKSEEIALKREARIKSQVHMWDSEYATINPVNLSKSDFSNYIQGSVKLSAQKMIISKEFSSQMKAIACDCSRQSKINFSQDSIKEAFKALTL